MKTPEATDQYQQAKRLYREGQYAEALALLEPLDETYPNTKDLMYARALTLAALGRLGEARAICGRLQTLFQDRRAQELMTRLDAAQRQREPAGETLASTDDDQAEGPPASAQPAPQTVWAYDVPPDSQLHHLETMSIDPSKPFPPHVLIEPDDSRAPVGASGSFTISEVFREAWYIYWDRTWLLVGSYVLSLLVSLASAFVFALLCGALGGNLQLAVSSGVLAAFLVGTPMQLGYTIMVLRCVREEEVGLSTLFAGFQRTFAACGAQLVVLLVLFISLAMCILPMFFVAPMLLLTFFYQADGERVFGATSASRATVLASYGKWFGLLLLLVLLNCCGCFAAGIGILVTFPYGYLVLAVAYVAVSQERDVTLTAPRFAVDREPEPTGEARVSGLAVASLVLALVPCPLIGAVPAVICGHRALRQIEGSSGSLRGSGLARAGLVLGYANIGVSLLFCLVPALGRAREAARRAECGTNLRRIGQACRQYAADHRGAYPGTLGDLYAQYVDSAAVFVCPSSGAEAGTSADIASWTSYTYIPGASLDSRSDTLICHDRDYEYHVPGGRNELYADGEVKFARQLPGVDQAATYVETPYSRTAGGNDAAKVYIQPHDRFFHRRGCLNLTAGAESYPESQVVALGYEPCPKCRGSAGAAVEPQPASQAFDQLPKQDSHAPEFAPALPEEPPKPVPSLTETVDQALAADAVVWEPVYGVAIQRPTADGFWEQTCCKIGAESNEGRHTGRPYVEWNSDLGRAHVGYVEYARQLARTKDGFDVKFIGNWKRIQADDATVIFGQEACIRLGSSLQSGATVIPPGTELLWSNGEWGIR